MDIRVLGYFLAVDEEQSFSAAAVRCRVAQPSLSRQIAGLERELGERLFVRGRDGAALTEAGETLVPYARAALSAIAQAHDAFAERTGLLTGTLRIGVVNGTANTRIPACAAALHRAHPGVRITMVDGTSRTLIEAVHARELDLAVAVSEVVPLPEELDSTTVMMDEVVAVAISSGFPHASGVSWPDLAGRPIISYTHESALAELIDAARADHQIDLMCATNDPLLHVAMARQGAGIALTAASMLPATAPAASDKDDRPDGCRDPDELDVRHFNPPLTLRKRLIWRRDAASSPAVRAFLNQVSKSDA
ncbi:LysR family transcriptional regulator [Bifidobacterium tibiigranuli]|jgi:DNA-binding transcriptional LysR family regulator|uniref:LysR family transcriptional regulator n=1 Tax=Bifidobacterium tibiigranuli TaxID=2172043 RepID=UPI0026EA37BB|nr:LysR family transcriptional regulator [Bifidobacterium tibiigranuli]MCI1649589.1 LysR family transcriptional regulator [Bifidobacterium tibiigranuli]MCI2186445.1 LysR family transcriptional regulator [Bifidobacterium tibiigranuli]MCI2204493.1 LysR family transcriptional regulator [Bifidobacterium tibiigranuli]